MEYLVNSAIKRTWKLCTITTFLALFFLTLLLTNTSTSSGTTAVALVSTFFYSPVAAPPPPPPAVVNTQLPFKEIEFAPPPPAVNAQLPSKEIEFAPPPAVVSGRDEFPAKEIAISPAPATPPVSPATVNGSAGGGKTCKMYEGKWVYKPKENPRYHVNQCPFLEEKMSCRRNGRPDSDYEGWSWEADGCLIPLFDGKEMVKRLRGKRMIIVGDSLNRNQWESLACLLYTSLRPKRTVVDARGASYKVLRAKDYNFTLEFYWAPFLVRMDQDRKSCQKVLAVDKLVPTSDRWRGAEVMVFNTAHWWSHSGKLQAWDVYEYKGKLVQKMEKEVAYERALTTWAHWITRNVDPTKTKVFFRSFSPEHKSKDSCFNASRPITDGSHRQAYPRSMIRIMERKITETKGLAKYLNITQLSSYRKDAHPSVYRNGDWRKTGEAARSSADCSHWCLPGPPDTWNRLLFAALFNEDLSPGDLSASPSSSF